LFAVPKELNGTSHYKSNIERDHRRNKEF